MCKKIGIAAIAVVAGLLVLNHTKVGNKLVRKLKDWKEQVTAQVITPEDEINTLKGKLKDFKPRLQEQINRMVEMKVKQDKDAKDITEQTARLAKQQEKILAMKGELETVKVKGGRTFTAKTDALESQLRSYQSGKEWLKFKQEELDRSKEKFAAAEAKLAAMQAMKVKLEADLSRLEVRLEIARAKQAQNENATDDVDLGDLKEDFAKLEERISKMEVKNDLEAQYLPSATETTPKKAAVDTESLFKEIDDEFGPAPKTDSKVARDRK